MVITSHATSTDDTSAPRCMFDEAIRSNSEFKLPVVRLSPPGPVGVLEATTAGESEVWDTIRFQVFTRDIEDSSKYCTQVGQVRSNFMNAMVRCSADSVLTPEKKYTMLTGVIPTAVKMHTDRLMVKPLNTSLKVPKIPGGMCGNYNIPPEHHTAGVPGADMVLYGSAGPMGMAAAWAAPCALLDYHTGRPIFGVFNIGPEAISTVDGTARVLAHEIAHALGFGHHIMVMLGMVANLTNVRGKPHSQGLKTPKVVEVGQLFFGCSTITSVELEDEGGSGTVNSHWEARNLKEEMMTGVKSTGGGFYSAFTMAFFEDTGLYKAKWGAEESMNWGYNAGCRFLEEKCVVNGKSNFPEWFCDSMLHYGERACTADRRGLGNCRLGRVTKGLQSHHQYFGNEGLVGVAPLMDFCPIVEAYSNTGCIDGDANMMLGSRIGPNSRCVKGVDIKVSGYSNLFGDVCVDVDCNSSNVRLRLANDDEWRECTEGTPVTSNKSFASGHVICPKKSDVCQSRQTSRGLISFSSSDTCRCSLAWFGVLQAILWAFLRPLRSASW
ncbi:putative surface protease [Trypanosoma vivax]|nr:putative surface protease [Trypanosoma vivax]